MLLVPAPAPGLDAAAVHEGLQGRHPVHLLAQDVIWVGGGSVAALLAVWRLHGLESIMREAWEQGVVLAGSSAGSICWHAGGTTDSFGPELRPVTDGLALIPASNSVHHDSEPQRINLVFSLVFTPLLFTGCSQYPWPSLARLRWFQVVTAANPMTYVSEALRGALVPSVPHIQPWICLIVLLGAIALLMAGGIRGFYRRAID